VHDRVVGSGRRERGVDSPKLETEDQQWTTRGSANIAATCRTNLRGGPPQKPKAVRDLAAGEARDNRVVGGTTGSFKFFMNVEALP
jgi:hypothetical protein